MIYLKILLTLLPFVMAGVAIWLFGGRLSLPASEMLGSALGALTALILFIIFWTQI